VPLTPLGDRRTIYGKVSRFKLDEFLQLFDFPSPSQTAEQRYATTVPLQRLFFMNSDFVQQHAERLAERVADEPDDAARIAAVYRLIYGRAPTAAEVTAGRTFLKAEALKQYEERKVKAAEAKGKPEEPLPAEEPKASGEGDGMPDPNGMMAGVVPGAKASEKEAAQMRPITTFGRYVKVLLSANEFLFVS
jgi:Protein of unknown function (DUF1553)